MKPLAKLSLVLSFLVIGASVAVIVSAIVLVAAAAQTKRPKPARAPAFERVSGERLVLGAPGRELVFPCAPRGASSCADNPLTAQRVIFRGSLLEWAGVQVCLDDPAYRDVLASRNACYTVAELFRP
jgi:hypothetical protein